MNAKAIKSNAKPKGGLWDRFLDYIDPQPKAVRKSRRRKVVGGDFSTNLSAIHSIVKHSGSKAITLSALFRSFGFAKRSPTNIRKIAEAFRAGKLYIDPPLSMELPWRTNLRIYSFPVERLGDIFLQEEDMQGYMFGRKLFPELGLTEVTEQYKPEGSKDKLDLIGKDQRGFTVAIELKNLDGKKKALEQILRYIGTLKQSHAKVRGILVTGVRDLHTAKAFLALEADQRQYLQWYIYKYIKEKDTLTFHEVTYAFLQKHLGTILPPGESYLG